MRYTFGQYRQAARDPTYRVRLGSRGGPNTTGTLRAAVRAFHKSGLDEARAALDHGLSNFFARPANRSRAVAARQMFEWYVRLAGADGRKAFDYDVEGDQVVGSDILAVTVDLALLDPNGYAGRIVLWDKLDCTLEGAAAIAAPAMRVLVTELDYDRVDNIEVWHPGYQRRYAFSRDDALAGGASVQRLLERIRPTGVT